MKIFLWSLLAVYLLGFGFSFWIIASMGMITLGLCLLRSFLWPLWMIGLIPGEPQPMD